jgi:carbonic anhydrase
MWTKQPWVLLLLISLQATAGPAVPENVCSTGLSQSPINIDSVIEAALPDLEFKYKFTQMTVEGNKAINFEARPDSADNLLLEIDTVRYPLENIHMHNPSGHTLAGKYYPMEIHFVHTSIEGNRVIVAQWAEIGKRNPTLKSMLNIFSLNARKPAEPGLQFGMDPTQLLAPFRKYYQYEGSRFTAPCTENATWIVLKDAIEIGRAEVETLNRLVGKNNRAVQVLNARKVYSSQ